MSKSLERQPWTARIHVLGTNALLRMPPRAALAALDAAGVAKYAAVGERVRSDVRRGYEGYAALTGARLDARAMTRALWRAWPTRREAPALVRFGSDAFVCEVVHVGGWEHVAAALAAGRGAVIAGVHAGCGSLPAAWASRSGARVMTIRSAALKRHAGTPRAPHIFYGTEPTLIDYGLGGGAEASALKHGLDLLRAGGIIAALVDHRHAGRNLSATVFGQPVVYRSSFLEAARMGRAPIIPAFATASPRGFRIDYHPGVCVACADDLAAFAQHFAALHEQFLRDEPEQLSFVGFETQLFCPWALPSLNMRFQR
ncbi:MAG: hypothetical protein ACKVU1_13615 [bacterium]